MCVYSSLTEPRVHEWMTDCCRAFFTCLGCTRAANGSAHVGFPPLCLLAAAVIADLGEGFCPLKMPGPTHGRLFMNGQIPEQHANEAGRRERRLYAICCCGARQRFHVVLTLLCEPLHREQTGSQVMRSARLEEGGRPQKGVEVGYPINRPHLTFVTFPLEVTCEVVSPSYSNVINQGRRL